MAERSLPSSFDDNADFYEESRLQKFTRRLKEEPLIPLGCALTCWALLGASRSIRAGDHHKTNRMFRARIYAQGFTLVCMVAGSVYYAEERAKRKVFEGTLAEKKAKEKNEAWIKELEVRDQEEKDLIARREGLIARREEARRLRAETDPGSKGVAKSTLERREERRIGVLEAIEELLRRR